MSFLPLSKLRVYLAPWLHASTGLITVVALIFLVLGGVIFKTCLHHNFQLQVDLKQARATVETLHQQKQRLEQFEKIKKERPGVFKTFESKHLDNNLTPDVIQKFFQKWQKLDRSKINLKMGPPICHDSTLNVWRIPVVVTLGVLKDSQVYDLLYYLQDQLPGKIVLKQFSLKRIAVLTPEMVKQITVDKKDINLFEGKIEFDWLYTQCISRSGFENKERALESRF